MTTLLLFLLACTPSEPDPMPEPTPVAVPEPAGPEPRTGAWSATIRTPGGPLPFGIDLSAGEHWQAWLVNGSERIDVRSVSLEGDQLTLELHPYDARLIATVAADGESLDGHWEKTIREGGLEKLPFEASWGRVRRFPALAEESSSGTVEGTWTLDFSKTEGPTLAHLSQPEDAIEVSGTILTTTGDYRFLAGSLEANTLRLSAFDGSHAFLFQATLASDTLTGDFWSGSGWHESFTGSRAPASAAMPDGFALTTTTEAIDWSAHRFPDPDGESHTLADPAWAEGPRLIQIMGTWCPNCNDQTELLQELQAAWADRGLKVVSLAFEHGDAPRNAAQIKRYAAHHQIDWPILVAGFSDKREASKKLPFLDKIRAYPTLLFVDTDGTVVAVHTGFTGPAAPAEHEALRKAYDGVIASMFER